MAEPRGTDRARPPQEGEAGDQGSPGAPGHGAPPPGVAGEITAEALARLRRSGLRIDREGEFIHEGERVRHEGLKRALFRWLDRAPEGGSGFVLRLDAQRFATLEVDDTPLVVRALRWQGPAALLALSDGAEEALVPSTLAADDAGTLRCLVRGGRLPARLSASAAAVLAERIRETPAGPVLEPEPGRSFPLSRR